MLRLGANCTRNFYHVYVHLFDDYKLRSLVPVSNTLYLFDVDN